MKEKKLLNKIRKYDKIIIYGAGMVGQLVWRWLKNNKVDNKVYSFAVTYMGDNFSEFEGVPVKEISELEQFKANSLVIVATLENAHEDIAKTLETLGFEHIFLVERKLFDWISKKMLEEKQKNLYICATYYHVLISLVKILIYAQRADIILTDGLKKNYDLGFRITKFGGIDNVIYYDNARAKGFESSKCSRKRKNIKSFEKEITINIKKYKDVYIFYDYNKIGRYLQAKKCNYYLIEDCYDFMKFVLPVRFGDLLVYWSSKKYYFDVLFNLRYQAFGKSKYCKRIEVNDKNGIVIPNKKVVEVPKSELFAKLSKKNRNIVYKIFAGDFEIETGVNQKTALVLTQPLYKDGFVPTLETQIQVYGKIIEDVRNNHYKVYLKAHPRDDFPYEKRIQNIFIIDKNIPTEVFNFTEKILFQKAITINSSAIYNMNFVNEKEILGIIYLRKFIRPEERDKIKIEIPDIMDSEE